MKRIFKGTWDPDRWTSLSRLQRIVLYKTHLESNYDVVNFSISKLNIILQRTFSKSIQIVCTPSSSFAVVMYSIIQQCEFMFVVIQEIQNFNATLVYCYAIHAFTLIYHYQEQSRQSSKNLELFQSIEFHSQEILHHTSDWSCQFETHGQYVFSCHHSKVHANIFSHLNALCPSLLH